MTRPDVSDERRPQIIEAAIQVFLRKGYRKASMPEIARQAGLSIGGVYWYFKSKDEIIAAILERIFDQDFSALTELLGAGAPDGRPTAGLCGWLRRQLRAVAVDEPNRHGVLR